MAALTEPTITVTGTKVAGTGFGSRTNVRLLVDGGEVVYFTTGSGGTFSRTIPAQAPGTHVVKAWSTRGCATATLTVAAPTPPPPPTPTPTPGLPTVIPGDLYTHDFSKDGMGAWRGLTYPNSHEADCDPMLGWKEYRNAAKGRWLTQKFVTDAEHIRIVNGALELRCTPPAAAGQPWLAAFAGTFDGGSFTKSFIPPILIRYWIEFDLAGQDCEWPGAWGYRTWLYGDAEIPDWPEVYGRRAHANLHQPGKAEFASIAIPTGWHMYGALVLPDQVAVSLDGTEIARKSWPVGTSPLGLFLDSKAGLAAPPASPKAFAMRVAGVSVSRA